MIGNCTELALEFDEGNRSKQVPFSCAHIYLLNFVINTDKAPPPKIYFFAKPEGGGGDMAVMRRRACVQLLSAPFFKPVAFFMTLPSLRNRKRLRDIGSSDQPLPGAPIASATPAQDDVYALHEGELMHSTSRASAGKRDWLRLLPCLERQSGYTYVSCDGSSTGWHACVVAVGDKLHLRACWADMQVDRNNSTASNWQYHYLYMYCFAHFENYCWCLTR